MGFNVTLTLQKAVNVGFVKCKMRKNKYFISDTSNSPKLKPVLLHWLIT